jgi:hypothetical protein
MSNMHNVQKILDLARQMPLNERMSLAEALLQEAHAEYESEEIAVGQRGMAEFTDSTSDEDWSEFYPADLRTRKVG